MKTLKHINPDGTELTFKCTRNIMVGLGFGVLGLGLGLGFRVEVRGEFGKGIPKH